MPYSYALFDFPPVVERRQNPEEKDATGAEHAGHLGKGFLVIHKHQRSAADDHVEARVCKRNLIAAAAEETDPLAKATLNEQFAPDQPNFSRNVHAKAECAALDEGQHLLSRSTTDIENATNFDILSHLQGGRST